MAAAEPLLATYNERGEIEGVKYKQVSLVLINAVKEQQQQLTALQGEHAELATPVVTLLTRLEKLEKSRTSERRSVPDRQQK